MTESALLDDIVAQPGLALEGLLSDHGYSASDDSEVYAAVYDVAEEFSQNLVSLAEGHDLKKNRILKLGRTLDDVMPVIWPTFTLGRIAAVMGYLAYSGPAYIAGAGLLMGGVFGAIAAGAGAFLGLMISHYYPIKVTERLAGRYVEGGLEKSYQKRLDKEYASALAHLEE